MARFHGLLAMLLALAVAALVVLADQRIDTWTDGHLFLGWMGLWVVIFAATALLDSWSSAHRSVPPAAAAVALHDVAALSTTVRPGAPLDNSGHGL